MHLLAAVAGAYADDTAIIQLEQTPGDVVFFSAADTELALLADEFCRRLTRPSNEEQTPSFRLANVNHLRNHASVDLYIDEVAQHAKVIIASLLGGYSYWHYLIDQLVELKDRGITLVLLPGDDKPDDELNYYASVSEQEAFTLWRYVREGGAANASAMISFVRSHYFGCSEDYAEPAPLPRTLIFHPDQAIASLADWKRSWQNDQATAAILFYRAHLQSGNVEFMRALCVALQNTGLNPLPIAVASLKEPGCVETINKLLVETGASIILNTTSFAVSSGAEGGKNIFAVDCPVLQVILSAGNQADWEANTQGLAPRDLAMNIALPEVDGRIISCAVTFKELRRRCEFTQTDVIGYKPNRERMDWLARLAKNWCSLQTTPNTEKHVALVLANYPTKEGRIGNGVGLDTPASVINLLRALQSDGYAVDKIPDNGDALIQELLGAVTNDTDMLAIRPCHQSISLFEYRKRFAALPLENQRAVTERWGKPEDDTYCRNGRLMLSGIRFGNAIVAIQPARGYHLDLYATYHDPDLVPPHAYLAFYFWLRYEFAVDAIMHVGKHGNLEWLPGKSVALSASCWPDAILGPTPHVYPFIVNDPGEGSQAKRRAQAVIIDHLIPPLTRAETYGELSDLESLVDEYYEALSVDARRSGILRKQILHLAIKQNLHAELGFRGKPNSDDGEQKLLKKMDAYLCELKESQIRDGLHILGQVPEGRQRIDTLLALSRLPQGDAVGANQSILRALCKDFGFDESFDPLDCDMSAPWTFAKPQALADINDQPWRTVGDTRERLENFAAGLFQEQNIADESFENTRLVLYRVMNELQPALAICGEKEIQNSLHALNGRFVAPGPSGAPSRGRLDVLPTGRNFYSVDVRAIPTPTAWKLGFHSATLLLERYVQEHGEYPQTMGLSVWGTSTMRTGGDDVAQAFALMGVRPVWVKGSNRVTDFEVMPVAALGRPRVDVTLRVSGFFRDAFSNVISLFDAAVKKVAAQDEPSDSNPIRARMLKETAELIAKGMDSKQAKQQAGWRVYGTKPGSYGAGLQGLIDAGCWNDKSDLAEVYVNWGGYAYGQAEQGVEAFDGFRERLSNVQLVMHNQDNREHDILDSDDYYQFQGGMTAAVETLRGEKPEVFHGDHANPESPRIRTLKEEVNRVVRSRVANPKWIAGVMRHGYKGAFEMAATVDYLFAYDATTDVIDDYQYEMVTNAYLLDDTVREFLQKHNPNALREMGERLLEAMQRGMWQSPGDYQHQLEDIVLSVEHGIETGNIETGNNPSAA
ncbi:MAG: cobaltochelatase subunit CobN [Arenicellales bacterium WSBS_2016_MAG_OTU3]